MNARDIQNFSEVRTNARSYFCYLFSRNLPNRLPSISPESIVEKLQKIQRELSDTEGVYLLDERGVQISPTYLMVGKKDDDIGLIRSDRAYYYRSMHEKRCTITDPYPSLITKDLTVTASLPIMDEEGVIKYVACLDISISAVLKIAHPLAIQTVMGRVFRYAYGIISFSLFMVALLLFVKGLDVFLEHKLNFNNIKIKDIFDATILLTLALALFDLVKTLVEEEVLGRHRRGDSYDPNKTMVRFLGSIIIALSIEALMLVFKFAITDPAKIVNAVMIIGSVALLLFGLGTYIKLTSNKMFKE